MLKSGEEGLIGPGSNNYGRDSIAVNNNPTPIEQDSEIRKEAKLWAKEEMRQNGYKEIYETFLWMGYEAAAKKYKVI